MTFDTVVNGDLHVRLNRMTFLPNVSRWKGKQLGQKKAPTSDILTNKLSKRFGPDHLLPELDSSILSAEEVPGTFLADDWLAEDVISPFNFAGAFFL